MLHINELTYHIDGRRLFDSASVAIPAGHKVGVIGRNGSGKSTLFSLITGEREPDAGTVSLPRNARIGTVAQEAPDGPDSLLDTVLSADIERRTLLARAECVTDPQDISDIQTRLADIDAHTAPSRAAIVLAGLGFSEADQARPCADFSGGWRMRVALAAALFSGPDLLLLDEPTNYLDLEGVLWLTAHLKTYPHTALIVSHDIDLLNNGVQGIVHLARGKLSFTRGTYDMFDRVRRERQALDLKAKKKQDDERRKLTAFVDRFRAKATKARQAQSRIKALARLQPVTAMVEERVAPFIFPSPDRIKNPPLISLDQAATGYGDDAPVLRDMSLRLDPDDRIGLLGANGNGKSTFAKFLSGRLKLLDGRRQQSNKLTTGYFAQHQIDELTPNQTAYDHVRALMPDATQAQVRTRLGTLGFGAQIAQTEARHLSGGEKARLLFALAAFFAPDLLILDEPTNHLDTDARQALILALNEYAGAVILITHDVSLLEACAERLWLVANGTVTNFEGSVSDYRDLLLERPKKQRGDDISRARATAAVPLPGERLSDRRASAQVRAELAPYKKAVETIETQLQDITRALEKLDRALSDTELYEREPEKAQKLARQRTGLAKQHEALETSWLAESEKLEGLREKMSR